MRPPRKASDCGPSLVRRLEPDDRKNVRGDMHAARTPTLAPRSAIAHRDGATARDRTEGTAQVSYFGALTDPKLSGLDGFYIFL